MKRILKWSVLPLFLVVIAAALAWRAAAPTPVDVASAHRGDLEETLAATGVVEAVQASVAPKTMGRIAARFADEGDAVEAGQLLAKLDVDDLRAALDEREAALHMAQAEEASALASLKQERLASEARIAGARAAEQAVRARLQELEAGLRPQEVDTARETLASARAEQDLAQSEYDRMASLLDSGAVARADLDRARARLTAATAAVRTAEHSLALAEEGARPETIAAAKAELKAARAELAATRAAAGQVEVWEKRLAAARAAVDGARAAVAAARSMLAETSITAPIRGRVARRYLDVGDITGPTLPVFLVVDSSRIWVAAEVDEEDLSLVYQGQHVTVNAEALPEPVPARVAEVGRVALPRGPEQVRAKVVRCKVVLDREEPLLRAGMEVDVQGKAVLAKDALLIPSEAISMSSGDSYVYLVSGGALTKRKIETRRAGFRETEVTSGLQEGDAVVIGSVGGDLREGQRVAPRGE